ncbi:MAG: hypothetical protein ACP5D2_02710 [Candidatus Nanoarchaeia archaeon]
MESKHKKAILVVILVVGIILSFMLISDSDRKYFSITGKTCPGETGIISSISEVNFESRSDFMSGEVFISEFRTIPNGQCLYGSFSADEVSTDEASAKSGFMIDLFSHTQHCIYPIKKEKDIWYPQTSVEFYETEDERQQAIDSGSCGSINRDGLYLQPKKLNRFTQPTFPWDYWYPALCHRIVDVDDSIGTLENPTLDWAVDILFESSKTGEFGEATISNRGQTTAWLVDDKIKASWSGNLFGDRWCPSETQNDMLYNGNKWHISKPGLESEWQTTLNGFSQCVGDIILPNIHGDKAVDYLIDKQNNCNNNANQNYNNLLVERNFCTSYGECASIDGTNVDIELNQNIAINSLQLYVDAEVLGIYQEYGKPKIIDVIAPSQFSSETQATVQVNFKNDDPVGKGTFDLWIECPEPFGVISPTIYDISLKPQQQTSRTLEVTGISMDDVEKTCSAILKEKTTGDTSKKQFTLSMTGSGTSCTDETGIFGGDMKCIGDKIFECDEYSGMWEFKKDCAVDNMICESDQSGKAECVAGEHSVYGCNNCIDWLWAKTADESYCEPTVIIEKKFYKPQSWILYLTDRGEITQDDICPIILGVYGIFLLLGISIVFLIIKLFQKRRSMGKPIIPRG